MKALLFSSPAEAESAFYRAFEEADLEGMMAVWADEDDIACIHPGGPRLSGPEQVRDSWRQLFRPGPTLRISVTGRQLFVGTSLAVSSVVENIQVIGEPGARHTVMATNVYLLTPRGWRMLSHHASASPGPAPAPPPAQDPPVLH